MNRSIIYASLLAVSLTACKGEPAAVSGPASPSTPAPTNQDAASRVADDNLNAVLWVQTAVEYEAVSVQTYHAAAQLLDKALKEQAWNALVPEERSTASVSLPPAVILDVDETVLDNTPYQARLIRTGTEYDEVTWDA